MRRFWILGLVLLPVLGLSHDLGLTAIHLTRVGNATHVRLMTPLSRLAKTDLGSSPSPADFDLAVRSRLSVTHASNVSLKLDSSADLLEWSGDVPTSETPSDRAFYPEDKSAQTVVAEEGKATSAVSGQRKTDTPIEATLAGIFHILSGPDHVLFLCALVLLGGTLKSTLKLLTAFTLAHGITMALGAWGVVQVDARIVEPLIALSIVAASIELLRNREVGSRFGWGLAFCFGLVHGLGFAGGMSWAGLSGTGLASRLAFFSTGLEAGQVVIAFAASVVLFSVSRLGEVWSRRFAWAAATLVGMCGSYWFLERMI